MADVSTGIGFYDHLLGSLAHHGLFDLEIRATGDLEVDEHHTVEDVALVLGGAFAAALGDRAGIRRFGDSAVPMDESIATAVVDVGGRPYAVVDLPFRAERVGALPVQLVEHALEAFSRAAGATVHVTGSGRNDHHLAEAAFKALGRALRRGLRAGSAPQRGRVDEGVGRMTAPDLARAGADVAVVDYGAGNLVSIEQALLAAGARARRVTAGHAIGEPDLLVVPGVGAAAPAMDRLRAGGLVDPIRAWIAADRPFLGICLGLQLLFEGSDEDGAATLGVLRGRTVRLDGAPTLPHIGWNQVERRRHHPAFDGIAAGRRLLLRPLVRGRPRRGRPRAGRRGDRARHAVRVGRRSGTPLRRPVPSRAVGRRRPPPRGERRRPRGRRRGRRLMLRRRVIPCLDVAHGRVVKGTRFVDLVDAGDPPELAARYADEGADELVYLDITAAPEERATLLDIVERTARRAFIPLTVGGGVRSVDEMRAVLRAGADKVAINTRAVAEPDLVRACAARFGSQAVVVAIDARRVEPDPACPSGFEVVVRGGREPAGLDAVAWATRAVDLGAGELLVTSIDRDGTGSGFDTGLLRAISGSVEVPVIASGGAAGPADFVTAVREGGADAVLAAGIFHRREVSIAAVKAAMAAAGLPVRPIAGRAAA